MAISESDERVLQAIFDPEASPSSGIKIDNTLPEDAHVHNPDLLLSIRTSEAKIVTKIDTFDKSVRQTNNASSRRGVFDTAMREMDALIQEAPMYASLYNNRAQILRWYFDNEISDRESETEESKNASERAMADITKAISLASPSSPVAAVSPAQARLLAQAYTQRGTLYLALSLKEESNASKKLDLEEKSAGDFMMGGKYGNKIGKQMGVKMNPYARLCGEIVREAMINELEMLR